MLVTSSQSAALSAATDWIANAVTGSTAAAVAVLAIAFVGFGMLQGRIDVRRGATTILGCFLLFGAPAIASALMHIERPDGHAGFGLVEPPNNATAVAPSVPQTQPDPYAGASLIR